GMAIAVSAIMLTRLSATTPASSLAVSYLLFGLGFGLVSAPITNTAMSGMPQAQAGVAAAVAATGRQVGSSLGVAVIGSVVGSGLADPIKNRVGVASHAGWWVVAACGVAVLALGVITTGPRARHKAALVAAEFGRRDPDADAGTEIEPAA